MRTEEIMKQAIQMRKDWANGDALRDHDLMEPENIVKLKDISYTDSEREEDEKWHLTDIYCPADWTDKTTKTYPVIVSCHGGGWFYGDKDLYRFYCMDLATKGFVVVNYNYRRSPENSYPAAFLDSLALMEFVKKNQNKYHMNLSNLFLVGDSCGAQLASQICVYATSREYRDLFEAKYDVPVPKKVALNCGVYNMKDLLANPNDSFLADWYIAENTKGNIAKSFLNVFDYMNKDFPSTYLMMSVNDGLNIYTPFMKAKLEEFNISHEYHEYGQDNVNDSHVFHLNMYSKNGKICNDDEARFFLQ